MGALIVGYCWILVEGWECPICVFLNTASVAQTGALCGINLEESKKSTTAEWSFSVRSFLSF